MGIHPKIGYESWKMPKQGSWRNKRVRVCFNYDTEHIIGGLVVREDSEDPYKMIIALDDGRYILSTECMYSEEK